MHDGQCVSSSSFPYIISIILIFQHYVTWYVMFHYIYKYSVHFGLQKIASFLARLRMWSFHIYISFSDLHETSLDCTISVYGKPENTLDQSYTKLHHTQSICSVFSRANLICALCYACYNKRKLVSWCLATFSNNVQGRYHWIHFLPLLLPNRSHSYLEGETGLRFTPKDRISKEL